MAGALAGLAFVPGSLQAAAPSLTPEGLAQAIECRAPPGLAVTYAQALFNDHPPFWATPLRRNGHEGMLGLWTYRLDHPVTVFGASTDTIALLDNWLVVEMPRAQALALVRQRGMERVPVRATEQYARFLDPERGPMLGAFGDTEKAMMALAHGKPAVDEANATLFVGCNTLEVSRKDFLEGAAQADAVLMQEMGKGR
jgi:hypothetical protein